MRLIEHEVRVWLAIWSVCWLADSLAYEMCTHRKRQESEVLMLLLLSSSLLLGNLGQSHFILLLHYWFDSQSQHCATGMKSCTARPSSINKLSRPEGVCVYLVPSPVSWVMNMEQLLLCSVTHTQYHTKDKTVRVRVCLQSRLDQLNYMPWTSTVSGEAHRKQVEVNHSFFFTY